MPSSPHRIAISIVALVAGVGLILWWSLGFSIPGGLSPFSSGTSPSDRSTSSNGLSPNDGGPGASIKKSDREAEPPTPRRTNREASNSDTDLSPPPRMRIIGTIVDETRNPLSGASITLELIDRESGEFDFEETPKDDVPASTASSDSSGSFEITTRAHFGFGLLTVRHPDFVPGFRPRVRLEPDLRSTVNLGEIRLERGGLIRGRVLNPDRSPAPGIDVYTVRPGPRGAIDHALHFPRRLKTSAIGQTDENGTFEISRVRPGKAVVVADSPLHPLAFRKDLTLADGEVRDGVELHLAPGVSLTGTVTDVRGGPISGARVIATPGQEVGFRGDGFDILSRLDLSEYWDRDRTSTDDEGGFRLPSRRRNVHYNVAVSAPGYSPSSRDEVVAGGTRLRFVLERNGRLHGRVLSEITGRPIPDFSVEVRRSETPRLTFLSARRRDTKRFTSEEGEFVLTDLEPGSYVLTIAAPDHAPQESSPLYVSRDPRGSQATFTLPPGGRLVGSVLDDARKPVPGARVLLFRDDFDAGVTSLSGDVNSNLLEGSEISGSATTGSDGGFELRDLDSGRYRIRVETPGFASLDDGPIEIAHGLPTHWNPLVLSRGGELFGEVKDAEGQPRLAAKITLRRGDGFARTTETDEKGIYRFVHLQPGSYAVAPTDDHAPLVVSQTPGSRETPLPFQLPGARIEVSEGGSHRLDVTLPGEGRIVGTVIGTFDEDRRCEVVLYRAGAIVVSQTQSLNRTAAFHFEPLVPALYRVSLRVDDRKIASLLVPLEAGEEKEIAIPLFQGSLEGSVKNHEGHALAGAILQIARIPTPSDLVRIAEEQRSLGHDARLLRSLDLLSNEIVCDDEGSFRADYLEPGTYRVQVSHPGYARSSLEGIAVTDSPNPNLMISLAPGGGVEGRVVHAGTETGVSFASLILSPRTPGEHRTALSDDRGHFRLLELPPGIYQARLDHQQFWANPVLVRVDAGEKSAVTLEAYPNQEPR